MTGTGIRGSSYEVPMESSKKIYLEWLAGITN